MTTTEQLPVEQAAIAEKPRLVLMGEFSAGKSTLCNILLGGVPLPMQVTATRLPPVVISYGEPSAFVVDADGNADEVDPADLGRLQLSQAEAIYLTMQSDILELCDIIDMPGISDPNMPADTWDSVLEARDIVVWCTHATQAWRQSEAATWDRLKGATVGRNLLLINQFDKLRNPRDRQRVLSRVRIEAGENFVAVHPVSLLEALNAEDDPVVWQTSGVAAFMDTLVELVLGGEVARVSQPAVEEQQLALHGDGGNASAALDDFMSGFDHLGEDEVISPESAANVVPIVRPVRPQHVQPRPVVRERARAPRPATEGAAISFEARGDMT